MKRALFLSLLLLATPAAADPRVDRLLAKGEALTRAGDASCSAALAEAAMAAERVEADYARAIAAWGACEETRGRYGHAHRLVAQALEFAPPETTPAGKGAPWPSLRAALRRLDDRVARVLVTWPEGASLYVDGEAVGGVSGKVLAVNPGRRIFEARRGGVTIAAAERDARAGDLPAVHLEGSLTPTAPPDKTSPSVTPEPSFTPTALPHPLAPALSPRGVAVTVAYVGLGTAVIAGVVAGVLEAQRGSLAAPIPLDGCAREPKAPGCDALQLAYEQSRGARTAALVAGGIGLAAAGLGVGLWLGLERGKAPASAGLTIGGAW